MSLVYICPGQCQRLLKMFRDGVLLMDEVDMLLHPLKSELNFPIGKKVEIDFSRSDIGDGLRSAATHNTATLSPRTCICVGMSVFATALVMTGGCWLDGHLAQVAHCTSILPSP